jgi:hypothetical protein
MKIILSLIGLWVWSIIKICFIGLILSLIWPNIQPDTVISVALLYSVVTTLYKAFKK